MSWKNISAVIEGRLFLGKSVALYLLICSLSINHRSRLASWLRAPRVRWPRTVSRILSLSARTLFRERSLHREYAICVSRSKTSIMQTSWFIYLLHVNLSTAPYGRAALSSSTAFKASHEAQPLSLHIVGLHFYHPFSQLTSFIVNTQWCGPDEFTLHRR